MRACLKAGVHTNLRHPQPGWEAPGTPERVCLLRRHRAERCDLRALRPTRVPVQLPPPRPQDVDTIPLDKGNIQYSFPKGQ